MLAEVEQEGATSSSERRVSRPRRPAVLTSCSSELVDFRLGEAQGAADPRWLVARRASSSSVHWGRYSVDAFFWPPMSILVDTVNGIGYGLLMNSAAHTATLVACRHDSTLYVECSWMDEVIEYDIADVDAVVAELRAELMAEGGIDYTLEWVDR